VKARGKGEMQRKRKKEVTKERKEENGNLLCYSIARNRYVVNRA
jgi:hypothetical protein